MAYDFNEFQKDALTKPRDKAWENWAKFEKIGDKAQGYIRDVFFRASEGQFAEQRGLTLEQADGTLVNVGIKHIDFVLAKTDGLRLGDPVTIVFEKEIPATVKGHSPTKQFAFYGKNLPENAQQKTVAELEAEDRKIAAAESAAKSDAEKAFDGIATPATANDLPFESKPSVSASPSGPVGQETPMPTPNGSVSPSTAA